MKLLYKVGTVLLLSAMLSGCGQTAEVPELQTPVQRTPDTAKAEYGTVFDLDDYLGNVYSPLTEVAFLQGGKLTEICVKPGDSVKKGDALAKLDDSALQKQIESTRQRIADAESSVAATNRSAEIDMELATMQLSELQNAAQPDRVAIEKQQIAIERMKLSNQRTEEDQEANMSALRETLAQLTETEAEYILRAPCDGEVTWLSDKLKLGYTVPAETPMFYLLQTDSSYIQTTFISNGTLQAAPQIYAIVDNQQYELTPVMADSEKLMADSLAGKTLYTQFHFADESVVLQHGSYAIVCMMKNYKENVLCVPSNAVFSDDSGYYVYKIDNDRRIRTTVSVGTVTALRTEIVSGLQEGDEVYVQG